MVGLLSFVSSLGTFPGQPNNKVGHVNTTASTPASFTSLNGQTWPGAFSSLTAWPGGTGAQTLSGGTNATSGAGTSGNPWVFAFRDFDALSSGTITSLSNAIFVGCRFQSNNVNDVNVQVTGSNVNFIYCSLTPRTALWTSPPNYTWPSAGAGTQFHNGSAQYTNSGGYCVPSSDGYQYGFKLDSATGPVTIDHCDIWGFGNSITFLNTTSQMNVTNNHIHDGANCNVTPPGAATNYHLDGPGYLNGGTPPTHVLIQGNTIASISNTNAIAFQAASSAYSFISVIGNYLTGFNQTVDMCHNATGNNNLQFTDNVIATDLQWVTWGGSSVIGGQPIYADFSTQFSGNSNLWRRNVFKVIVGTSQLSGTTLTWTGSDTGKYVLPNQTLSSSDWSL